MTNREENDYLKGVYGKFDIISLRVAIINHGMNMACEVVNPGEITSGEMESALTITEYFRSTALKVYRCIFEKAEPGKTIQQSVAMYMLDKLKMNKVEIVKTLKTSKSQVDRLIA